MDLNLLSLFIEVADSKGFSGDDMLFVHRCALVHLGLAGLPDYLARDDVLSGKLVRLFPHETFIDGALHLLHPPLEHTPKKLEAFRDALRDYMKTQPMAWEN